MIRSVAAAACFCLSAAAQASAVSGGYSLQLVDARGRRLPTFRQGGHTYVMGTAGQRYELRLRNLTDGRVEMVAAVDGRDVVDGRPSTLRKRGYVLGPHSEVRIEGFRLGEEHVAAFRFGSVKDSYAVRMGGDASDVGLVAVAVFTEAALPAVAEDDGQPPTSGAPAADAAETASAPRFESGGGGAAGPAPAEQKVAPAGEVAPLAAATPPAPAAVRIAGVRSVVAERARPAEQVRAPVQLGTTFGEEHRSHVDEAGFHRASSRPAAFLSLRYESRESLEALGIDVDARLAASREARRRQTAQPFRRNEPDVEETTGVLAR
ncbi:MAG TPA: hypothetical protein VMB50_08230 [Myxococcales bacterium]|nr:hypothetical protein [Myxococcales bacterium]